MDYYEWLKKLKPGDDVIVCAWNWGSSYTSSKVEKITPTGLIRVLGILYKPNDGYSKSGSSNLLNPKDEDAIEKLKEYKERKFVIGTMYKIRNTNSKAVTYEQAVQINKIMGWEDLFLEENE